MANPAPRKSKRSSSRSPQRVAPDSPEARTLDPTVEAAIMRLLRRFLLRTAIVFLLVAFLSTYLPSLLHIPPNGALAVVFISAFGVMIPYWKGLNNVFREILRLGREKLAQRRYADARHALEYFHKLGNMGFDLDGEAHYHLMLAYLGLGELDKAQKMTEWLQKYRKRFPWAEKAATALTARMPTAENAAKDA